MIRRVGRQTAPCIERWASGHEGTSEVARAGEPFIHEAGARRCWADRPAYHIVKDVAREIASARSLSAFVRRNDLDVSRALEILELNRFEPD